MASIEFENVVKVYSGQKKPVVPNLNLKIEDKEFIILVGPSGCGKSTTLRMIAGLEDITRGTLRIDGKKVNDVPARDRDIAMVFQSYALYPNMTVYKNIAFPLKVRKLTQEDIEKRVETVKALCKEHVLTEEEKTNRIKNIQDYCSKHVLTIEEVQERVDYLVNSESFASLSDEEKDIAVNNLKNQKKYSIDEVNAFIEEANNSDHYITVEIKQKLEVVRKQKKYTKEEIDAKVQAVSKILDLEQYLDRKPANLSGGQRQRVALGRAMVRSPKVFLLDEPLSNLDAKLRTEMRSQISLLHKKLNTTFVYVTHDQTEAMTIADKIAVLDKGILQQFDTPRNLYERPVNKFVAGFIGSPEMNFLKANVVEDNSGVKLSIANRAFKVNDTLNRNNELNSYVNSEVTYGIRPENITLVTEDNKESIDKATIYKVHVKIAEFLGAELYLYFDLADTQCVCRTSAKYKIRYGDDIYISLNPNKGYIFNSNDDTISFPEPSQDISLHLDLDE